MFRTGHVQDRTCSGQDMFRTGHVQDRTCSGPDLFRTRHVEDLTCSGPDLFRTRHVPDQTCSGPDMFRTRHVQDQTCSGPTRESNQFPVIAYFLTPLPGQLKSSAVYIIVYIKAPAVKINDAPLNIISLRMPEILIARGVNLNCVLYKKQLHFWS